MHNKRDFESIKPKDIINYFDIVISYPLQR
jgi:hypothetical protein